MADTKYEASCLHCKHWDERPESNKKGPVHLREGVCNGKFNGDYVTANQYCLGFLKRQINYFFLTNYLLFKKDKNRKRRKICLCKRCCKCAQQYCIAGLNPKCSRFKSASLIRLLVASVFIIDVATMFSLTLNLREITPTSCNKPLTFSKTRSIFARAELIRNNSLINVDFFTKKKYILCSTLIRNNERFFIFLSETATNLFNERGY